MKKLLWGIGTAYSLLFTVAFFCVVVAEFAGGERRLDIIIVFVVCGLISLSIFLHCRKKFRGCAAKPKNGQNMPSQRHGGGQPLKQLWRERNKGEEPEELSWERYEADSKNKRP